MAINYNYHDFEGGFFVLTFFSKPTPKRSTLLPTTGNPGSMFFVYKLFFSSKNIIFHFCNEFIFFIFHILHCQQQELFLSEVNNRETIAAIETKNDMHYLLKRIEKFPLNCLEEIIHQIYGEFV